MVIRDDGSSDNTLNILKSYENKHNIQYYSGDNKGAAQSFFDLLMNCGEFDYYAFCDQDDVWKEDKIYKAVKKFELEGNDNTPMMYCSNAALVDENLVLTNKKTIYNKKPNICFESSTCFCYCLGCTCVLNKYFVNVIRAHKVPKNMIMHDTYLEELCLAIDGKILYEHYDSVLYRQHSNNVSGYGMGNLMSMIAHRIRFILTHRQIGVAEQALDIVSLYDDMISAEHKKILNIVAGYKSNLLNRCRIVFSRKVKYKTVNTSIMYRLAALMGNL